MDTWMGLAQAAELMGEPDWNRLYPWKPIRCQFPSAINPPAYTTATQWPRSLLACLVPSAQPDPKTTSFTWHQPLVVQCNWQLSHPATLSCNGSTTSTSWLPSWEILIHRYRDLIMISSYFYSLKLKSCQLARFPAITQRVSDFAKIICCNFSHIAPAPSDLGDQSLAKAFLALLR